MQQEQLWQAYDYCRRVTQQASKTFYWGSMFLPPPKRRAIWAVYAFCRVVDDVVDEALDPQKQRPGHLTGSNSPEAALAYWRQSLERIYTRGGTADGPIQLAWSDVIEHYAVPVEPALDLLKGVAMDLRQNRYETFEDLHLYCYRVAGTVGLLTSPIFGYHNKAALAYAADLGVALQLTNILRDIGEDARRDRIYIPQNEMRQFSYSEGDLMTGVINDAFRQLVRFQIARADEYYQRSQPGIAMLSEDSRLAIRLSGSLYRGILDRIHLNNYNVFTKRASVPLKTKLAAASQYWFMQQYEMMVKGADGA
jgi:phytoene synthase